MLPTSRLAAPLRAALVLLLLTGLVVPAAATASTAGAATVPLPRPPRTPRGLPGAIEPLTPYVEQVACDPRRRPGTTKLARLLMTTYRSAGASWASDYACGTDGSRSEHYDGRAIDWMVDVHDRGQHRAARSFLSWLLATDPAGNRFAMARRLGVMYVIYDNRMWGAWDGRWEPYNSCAKTPGQAHDNACHRTHMHISLGWNGAMGTTTFWTRRLWATDYGPCLARDLNWAGLRRRANPRQCPPHRTVSAARGATALKRTLVRYSGVVTRAGWTGPAVTALQLRLHVPATGQEDGRTVRAVRALQRRVHLRANGLMTGATWRALLRRTR